MVPLLNANPISQVGINYLRNYTAIIIKLNILINIIKIIYI